MAAPPDSARGAGFRKWKLRNLLLPFFWKTLMADEAKTPSQLADAARGIASDAQDVAADAVDTGKAYAENAVNQAGKKIVSFEERAAQWHASCTKRISADPVKSVLLAAAGGALLAGLLLAFDRSDRPDWLYRGWHR